MYLSVIAVEPLDAYKLELTYEKKEHRILGVLPYLGQGKYAELIDRALFCSVRASFDLIQWDNEMDFDPEFLYQKGISVGSVKC